MATWLKWHESIAYTTIIVAILGAVPVISGENSAIVLGILSQLLVWKKSYVSGKNLNRIPKCTRPTSPHPHLNKKRSSCPWTIRRLKILSVSRNPGPSNRTSSIWESFGTWKLYSYIYIYIYIQVSEVMGVTPLKSSKYIQNISKSWMIMT